MGTPARVYIEKFHIFIQHTHIYIVCKSKGSSLALLKTILTNEISDPI